MINLFGHYLLVFDAFKINTQKEFHDFKEINLFVRVGTLEPMRMKDILTKIAVFAVTSVLEYK